MTRNGQSPSVHPSAVIAALAQIIDKGKVFKRDDLLAYIYSNWGSGRSISPTEAREISPRTALPFPKIRLSTASVENTSQMRQFDAFERWRKVRMLLREELEGGVWR